MKSMVNIVQTIGMSFVFVVFLKTVSLLRKLWLKIAVKTREEYNKKNNFHPKTGVGEIDVNSLSYQIDSVEGGIVSIVLFLLGLLFTLFLPLQKDFLFCIIANILAIVMIIYCWFVRDSKTKKYRMLVYMSCILCLLFVVHIVISLILDTIILVGYSNSINAILYICSTLLAYKLFF